MKLILREFWRLIAYYIPGGTFLLAIIFLARARKLNFQAVVSFLISIILPLICHVDLPGPMDWMEFPRPEASIPTDKANIVQGTIIVQGQGPETSMPEIASFQGRRYRVVNVLAGDTLSVRSGAGVNFREVGLLPHDSAGIEIVDEPSRNDLDLWVRIVSGELQGWVNAKFLVEQKKDAPSKGPPPVQTPSKSQDVPAIGSDLVLKFEDACVKYYNKSVDWNDPLQITNVKERHVVFYNGKKAAMRLHYEYFIPPSGKRGSHKRLFRLRWTIGNHWVVDGVEEAVEEPLTRR